MENRKQPSDFHLPFHWLFCKIDQLIWKVNITVITNIGDKLATRNHSECGHQQLRCKLDSECWPNCTTVTITLQLRFGFCKMYFRSHFSDVYDLEYCYHFAMFIICLRRKLEWPQSPLTMMQSKMLHFLHVSKFTVCLSATGRIRSTSEC